MELYFKKNNNIMMSYCRVCTWLWLVLLVFAYSFWIYLLSFVRGLKNKQRTYFSRTFWYDKVVLLPVLELRRSEEHFWFALLPFHVWRRPKFIAYWQFFGREKNITVIVDTWDPVLTNYRWYYFKWTKFYIFGSRNHLK